MKRQEKGITLVALVVTIIVLLILAGVAINMVLGENGYKVSKEDVMVERETTTKNPIKDKDGRFHIAIELKDVRFVASLDKMVKTFSDSKKPK